VPTLALVSVVVIHYHLLRADRHNFTDLRAKVLDRKFKSTKPTPRPPRSTRCMVTNARAIMRLPALLMLIVLLAISPVTTRAQQRPSPTTRIGGQPTASAAGRASPNVVAACFVRNCLTCNSRNSYLCTRCLEGYVLTASLNCNSCAPGYEQNLDERTFVCVKCPPGFTSPGGTGEASQCVPISVTTGRRLFGEEGDMWSWS
jgi:hypothetical protein